jgi:hypothetical protein
MELFMNCSCFMLLHLLLLEDYIVIGYSIFIVFFFRDRK